MFGKHGQNALWTHQSAAMQGWVDASCRDSILAHPGVILGALAPCFLAWVLQWVLPAHSPTRSSAGLPACLWDPHLGEHIHLALLPLLMVQDWAGSWGQPVILSALSPVLPSAREAVLFPERLNLRQTSVSQWGKQKFLALLRPQWICPPGPSACSFESGLFPFPCDPSSSLGKPGWVLTLPAQVCGRICTGFSQDRIKPWRRPGVSYPESWV